jgi:hypothetical protein
MTDEELAEKRIRVAEVQHLCASGSTEFAPWLWLARSARDAAALLAEVDRQRPIVAWLAGFSESGIMIGNAWDASAHANYGECLCCHIEGDAPPASAHAEDCEWRLARAAQAKDGGTAT